MLDILGSYIIIKQNTTLKLTMFGGKDDEEKSDEEEQQEEVKDTQAESKSVMSMKRGDYMIHVYIE